MARMANTRIGIPGWRYPPWRGVFYPKDLVRLALLSDDQVERFISVAAAPTDSRTPGIEILLRLTRSRSRSTA